MSKEKSFFARVLQYSFIIVLVVFVGCATTSSDKAKVVRPQAVGESSQEIMSAVEQVLGSVSGKPIDQKGLKDLGKELRTNPEAQSAVAVIKDSVSGQGKVVKYCPIDGERYSPKFDSCPVHHVLLKSLND